MVNQKGELVTRFQRKKMTKNDPTMGKKQSLEGLVSTRSILNYGHKKKKN